MARSETLNVIEDQKREAQQVKEMLETDGWKIVEVELNARVQELTRDMIESNDAAASYCLKTEIRAIQALMQAIVAKAVIR